MAVEKADKPQHTHSSKAASPDIDRDQQPARLADCRRCALWRDATQPVGGEGPRNASIMLVGEQPGDAEDLQGRPFVGPAGALLNKALEEAGLERADVYVTNAVKHFKWTPRGKRRMHKTPAQREVAACEYWLEREFRQIEARVIVTLGATALKAVLDDAHSRLQDALGKTIEHGEHLIVATYHPSFALRAPDPETRRRVYETIVESLQTARKLSHQHKRST
ncbi:UdgX family uracil-DNA binding protein [Paraburkholderia panacisoli]|uniref:Type-4 uracil-DNA glycosylase n=1 Tax=Paraburkholderia panacisoli TaxID=2603818 RepID=A0A5B0GVQ0_9BURK|nr:UdgX family uracil-DNA binding protein [Paraburkholderia panacisoli]KAA1006841.1 UdgX family uracil-DNA binding protein [Paraburkholderia panacisoli]